MTMERKLLFIICFILTQSIWCQRFPGNTVLKGTNIEFRAFTKISNTSTCEKRLEVRFITPSLRKDFNKNDKNSIGYTYKVQLINAVTNQIKDSKTFLPSKFSDKNSINWYRYTSSFFRIEKGAAYFVKVLLVKNNWVRLNFGGFLQEPRIFSLTEASAKNASRVICTGSPNNSGKPNLTISQVRVTNGNGRQYFPLANETPILRRRQSFEVSSDVINRGNTSSKATDLRLLVGATSSINSATEFAVIPVPILLSNASKTIRRNEFIVNSDLLGSYKLSPGRSYYIFIKVDETNINKESNENDNLKSFKFTYSGLSGKIGGGDGNCIICDAPIFAKTNLNDFNLYIKKPYNIDVFDFSGQKILNTKVNSIEQENQIIQSLPKKLYIIKSKNGDRKVSN